MSLVNALQKIFGFTYDDESLDTAVESQGVQAMSDSSHEAQPVAASVSTESLSSSPREPHNSEPDIAEIFSGVVRLLNNELPPYLRESLNEESQKKFIYANLDESLRKYLEHLAQQERQRATQERAQEHDKLKKTIEGLKEKLKNTEEHLAKEAEKALSAERQKRALAIRTKDNEDRIATLEAEKEQYDLENRSLMNKLRAAEVISKMNTGEAVDAAALLQQQEELKKLLDESEQRYADAGKKIQELTEKNEAGDREIESLKAENSRLNVDLAELNKNGIGQKDENEQLREQGRLYAERIKELEDKESELKRENSELISRVGDLEKLSEFKKEYEDIKSRYARLEDLNRQLEGELTRLSQRQALEDAAPVKENKQVKETSSLDVDTPTYGFISFDENVDVPKDDKVSENDNSVPMPDEKEEKKTLSRKKKQRNEELISELDNTDWMLTDETENIDRVVPTDNESVDNKNVEGGPQQLSLW